MEIYIPNDKTHTVILNVAHSYQKKTTKRPLKRAINLYFEFVDGGKLDILLPKDEQFETVIIPKLNWYNQNKGILLEEAESNLNYLAQVLKKYFEKSDYPEKEKPLYQLDFMGKRDILSNYLIKKDQIFWTIEGLKTKDGRKIFTKVFNDYILDRNILAHGILVIWMHKQRMYIEHKVAKTEKTAYAWITDKEFDNLHYKGECLNNILVEMDKLIKK